VAQSSPTTDAEAYAAGFVPTRLVAPLLRRGLLCDFDDIYAAAAGSLPRILTKWEVEQAYAEYNSVDNALAKVNMVHAWREEQPEAYYSPVLREARGKTKLCANTRCGGEFIPARTNQLYCGGKCREAVKKRRIDPELRKARTYAWRRKNRTRYNRYMKVHRALDSPTKKVQSQGGTAASAGANAGPRPGASE